MSIKNLRASVINSNSVDINIAGFSIEKKKKKDAEVDKNNDVYFTMRYILDGEGYAIIDGKRFSLTKNTLFITFPRHNVQIRQSPSNPYTLAWFSFDGAKAKQWLERIGLTKDSPIIVLEQNDTIIDIFKKTPHRCQKNKANSDIIALHAFYTILYTIISLRKEKHYYIPNRAHTKEEHVQQAISYIESNYSNPKLNMQTVAEFLFLTPKHFSSIFKQVTGTNFTSYLQGVRISVATTLMESGETSIGNIATMVGFSSYYYFANLYKKYCNCTPTEQLKKIAKKNTPYSPPPPKNSK